MNVLFVCFPQWRSQLLEFVDNAVLLMSTIFNHSQASEAVFEGEEGIFAGVSDGNDR